MAISVQMIHPATGIRKNGYFGFSWTSFFFGGFPALLRGDVGIGLGMIAVGLLAGALGVGLGWFVVGLIWAFIYNGIYTKKLIETGYRFADTEQRNREAMTALGVGDQAIFTKPA